MVPFGMNMPLYVSSCIVLCGMPGSHSRVSISLVALHTLIWLCNSHQAELPAAICLRVLSKGVAVSTCLDAPQDFLEDGLDVRQILSVVKVGQPVGSDDSVDLLLRLLQHVGVKDHRQNERVDRGVRLSAVPMRTREHAAYLT